jgi:hypothetical protein
MKKTQITLPELGLIAGTRAMLGAGIGLLLAGRMPDGERKAVGWTLLLTGAISTIPLALEVMGHRCESAEEKSTARTGGDSPLEPRDRLSGQWTPGMS